MFTVPSDLSACLLVKAIGIQKLQAFSLSACPVKARVILHDYLEYKQRYGVGVGHEEMQIVGPTCNIKHSSFCLKGIILILE